MVVGIYVGKVVPNVEWRTFGATYNPGLSVNSASYIAKRQRTPSLTGQVLTYINKGLRMLQSVNASWIVTLLPGTVLRFQ